MFDKPDEYEGPNLDDRFQLRDHVDRLVAIKVEKYEPAVTTKRGDKPAVGATVTVIDGPDAGRTFTDSLLFGAVIVPQLKEKVGRHVLGRIYEGEAKNGDNPPYKLREATDQETEYAVRFLADKPAQAPAAAQPATPAAAAAAPAGAAPRAPWEQ